MDEITVQAAIERPYFMSPMDDVPVVHLSAYMPDWMTIVAFLTLLATSLIACSFAPENRKTALALGILFLGCCVGMVSYHLWEIGKGYSLFLHQMTTRGSADAEYSLFTNTASSAVLILFILLFLLIWAGGLLLFFYKKAVRKVWKGQK